MLSEHRYKITKLSYMILRLGNGKTDQTADTQADIVFTVCCGVRYLFTSHQIFVFQGTSLLATGTVEQLVGVGQVGPVVNSN